jgi:D-alanyl-D-alanine dipeptidase
MAVALLSDPCVAGVPVVEDGSPLVDLAQVGILVRAEAPVLPPGIHLGPRHRRRPKARTERPDEAAPVGAHRLARRTLAERLATADALLPDDVRLLVVEGLRPMRVQRLIHAGYRARLGAQWPGLEAPALDRLASRFVAPPASAPHVSGAAVDLTLVGDDGRPLDLGTPIDATPEDSDGACYFDAPGISREARRLRTLLATALEHVGLVNYPTEWWHWSFGDRYWAHVTGSPFAIHGPVTDHDTVGADAGPPVGSPTGPLVGSPTGPLVGSPTGPLVGSPVGSPVSARSRRGAG